MALRRKRGFYEKYIKRALDILCAVLALTVFCWLYALLALLVAIRLGRPVIFKQPRPGMIDPETGKERIFYMYKFRTMSEERDEAGKLLPDDDRLSRFGRILRASSLDELPEAVNILKGDMSVVGPRPQLVKDMVFMTERQRMRHTAVPGLSGLAQVMGRNAISWEEKFDWDLRYLEHVSFLNDLRIVLLTVKNAFGVWKDTEEVDVSEDFGDVLLRTGKITRQEYESKQAEARRILGER